MVSKLRSTRSLLDKNKCRKRLVLTEEKLEDIGTRYEVSPKKSFHLLALQCEVAKNTAQGGTKLLKLTTFSRT
jgi:hypothetical protein